MTIYSRKQAEGFLTRAGWVIAPEYLNKDSYRRAVEDFQRGYTWSVLDIDGIVGVKTTVAMIFSEKQGYRCSPNFRYREFLCECKGSYVGCRSIRIDRALLVTLESARAKLSPKTGIYIVSGYRCPRINKAVGGREKPLSHHVTGNAVDIPAQFRIKDFDRKWGIKGIGATRRDIKKVGLENRRAVHIDNGERTYLPFQE